MVKFAIIQWTVLLWTIIYLLLLIAYYATVELNLVFTFHWLKVTDVPFYSTDVAWVTLMMRYGFYWWLTWSDFFLILPPVFFYVSSVFMKSLKIETMWWYSIVSVAGLFFGQLIKMAIYFGMLIWCNEIQACRPYDGSTGSFLHTNYVYEATLIGTAVSILALIIWILAIAALKASIDEKDIDEMDLEEQMVQTNRRVDILEAVIKNLKTIPSLKEAIETAEIESVKQAEAQKEVNKRLQMKQEEEESIIGGFTTTLMSGYEETKKTITQSKNPLLQRLIKTVNVDNKDE